VQLTDDDALGAIDHEGSERREQGQLAEVDLLLDDVARALLSVHLLVDDELQGRLERCGVGHVALDAFADGILRLAERIPDEFQRVVLVDVRDREEVLEYTLETDVLTIVGRGIQLQQRLEGARLDVEEMRHFHPLVELAERNLLHCLSHESPTRRRKGPSPAARAKNAAAGWST